MKANKLREHARVLRCRVKFIGDDDTGAARMERDALLAAADLLEREAHALETQYTHSDECWKSGKMHYECAVREIMRLTAIQHPNTASGVGSATVEVMCAKDSKYYEDLLDEHVAEIEKLKARIAELEAVLADANQRDLIVLRAQKAELERHRDLLADEVERLQEGLDDYWVTFPEHAQPATVTAILAARKEKRNDQS